MLLLMVMPKVNRCEIFFLNSGPQPPKRPRMNNVEVILLHGGTPYLATAQSNEGYYLMVNHDDQISVSRRLFANSDDSALFVFASLYLSPKFPSEDSGN